jgi:multimeric flavodoxin WrbA
MWDSISEEKDAKNHMKLLGIYGSPRAGGNTEMLLDQALKGATDAGAEVGSIRCCDLNIEGCAECGGCENTGACIIDDDMQQVYPLLLQADAIILASPIFFYGITAQAKAVIDRCQAMWCRRLLETTEKKRNEIKGSGYLILVGATKGSNLFEGAELVAKYFYDALHLKYQGGLLVRSVEGKGDIADHPVELKRAYQLGKDAVLKHASLTGSK